MSSKIKGKERAEALRQQQKADQSVYKYIWHSFSEATLLFVLIAVLECYFCLFSSFIPTVKRILRAFLIREIEVSKRREFPCQGILPHYGDGCLFGKSPVF